jgi:ATP-dependent Clp protease protease subunit
MPFYPTFVEEDGTQQRQWDVYSRLMKERILFLQGQVEQNMANHLVASLLLLDSQSNKDITLYVNSPGGSVNDGLAIYDTMNLIKSKVHTVVVGQAASMGSFLAMSGEKGHRYMLPSATHMVHQPSTAAQGMVSDIAITFNESNRLKDYLTAKYVKNTKKSKTELVKMMDRDTYLTAEECLDIGLCDHIMANEKI